MYGQHLFRGIQKMHFLLYPNPIFVDKNLLLVSHEFEVLIPVESCGL